MEKKKKKEKKKIRVPVTLKDLSVKNRQTNKQKRKEENLTIWIHLEGYPVSDLTSWAGQCPQAACCILSSIKYTRMYKIPPCAALRTQVSSCVPSISNSFVSQILHLLDVKGFRQSLDAVGGQAMVSQLQWTAPLISKPPVGPL